LLQESSITDLTDKYYLAFKAIALQTCHIVEALNTAGHDITPLYMSSGQANDAALCRHM
ncbi:hypothetical protein DEU56DRAFT_722648, partial [Suillus clintonianus]|uniref:uncharacterized protein n=1 Tax=Suillus clintonianus TaxID=1904413 RepID=UPI001B874709